MGVQIVQCPSMSLSPKNIYIIDFIMIFMKVFLKHDKIEFDFSVSIAILTEKNQKNENVFMSYRVFSNNCDIIIVFGGF